MDWNNFASPRVRVEYANTAKVNKIRAWCRKNNASSNLTPYTKGAYEGVVIIHTTHLEGKDETDRKVAELKALIAGK